MTEKIAVTLEQLELFKKFGYENKSFQEALEEHNITDDTIISELSFAYDMGEDERLDEQYKEPKEAVEKTFTKEETERDINIFLSPITPLFVKHITDDHPINGHTLDADTVHDAFGEMRDKITNGDRTYLYNAILSQLGQMQQMSIKVNNNLASQTKVDTVMKYANIQLKLMAEQRRTIQVLDDLMNPKKTTFVKEVSQHNHFSEKKSEIENKISQGEIDADQYTEAETITEGTD